MLLVIFGLAGVGKNYVGEVLAQDFGFAVYDADQDLTPEIIEIIKKGELPGDGARGYYFKLVADKTEKLLPEHKNLAVTQMFRCEKDRVDFLRRFPAARFVLVEADQDKVLNRLGRRQDHLISARFGRRLMSDFEKIGIPFSALDNNGDRPDLQAELKKLLDSLK